MMQGLLFVILLGVVGGVAVGLQAPMMNMFSSRLGILESVFIVHLCGAIVGLIPLLVQRGGNLNEWRTVPLYAYLVGVLGFIFVVSISHTIPRIGAAGAIMLVVAGQFSIAMLIDHFGLFGIEARTLDGTRLLGAGALFIGVYLLTR